MLFLKNGIGLKCLSLLYKILKGLNDDKKNDFFDDGKLESLRFDDSKTVKELVQYAFDQFDYYEPAGMEIVTLFQCHHSKSNNGWFIRDTNRICAEEIEDGSGLCFAYHMPDVFYFAEGGWGNHMINLGNHPVIPNPVSLNLHFEDFKNTVVINGKYCFNDIIKFLQDTEYISERCHKLRILPIGIEGKPYEIPFSDSIMRINLTEFENKLQAYNDKYLPKHGVIYHEDIEIC